MFHYSLPILFALTFLLGCGGVSRVEPLPADAYEFESVTEQAVNAVADSDTRFMVDPADSRYVWDRAEFFFRHYLGVREVPSFSQAGKALTATDKAGYRWKVLGDAEGATGTFAVECIQSAANTDSSHAKLNAKNLARFLSTGTLEVDLLPKASLASSAIR